MQDNPFRGSARRYSLTLNALRVFQERWVSVKRASLVNPIQSTIPRNLIFLLIWTLTVALLFGVLPSTSDLPAAAQEKKGAIHNLSGATSTPGQIEVTWDAASPAPTDYRVVWAKKDEKFRSYRDEEGNAYPTTNSVTLTGLEEGAEYKIMLRSRYFAPGGTKPTSSGPWSERVYSIVASTPTTTTTQAPTPESTQEPSVEGAITGLTLTTPALRTLGVSWDPASPAPVDYQLNWVKGDDSFAPDSRRWNLYPTANASTLKRLEAGAVYRVQVRARYQDTSDEEVLRNGPWSESASLTVAATSDQVTPPSKPTGLMALGAFNQVILLWNDPGDDSIVRYRVLRGTDADTLEVITENASSASADYTDIRVSPETTYIYAIEAVNSSGTSERSTTAAVSTPPNPGQSDGELQVAHQSEAQTLVSTLHQPTLTGSAESGVVDTSPRKLFQRFTTGDNSAGYSLSGVMVRLKTVADSSVPRVRIRKSDLCPLPQLASNFALLTNPTNFSEVARERNVFTAYFTAPDSTILEPNTTYWIIFEETSDDGYYSPAATTTSEIDSGGAQSWTVGSGCGTSGRGSLRGLTVFGLAHPRSISVVGSPLE